MSHDDIDDEDEHLLHTQLHHNCDMLLHMSGLETGYSKDIHGEVCMYMYVHNTMTISSLGVASDRLPRQSEDTMQVIVQI